MVLSHGPTIVSNNSSVKSDIVSILSKNWPLGAKKIYFDIKKRGHKVTYQAVHKSLKELVATGIIEKSKKKYEISEKWLEELRAFASSVGKYAGPPNLPTLREFVNDGEIKSFHFHTFEEMEVYRKKLQWEFLSNPNKEHQYYSEASHLKSPIVFSEKSLSILDMIKEMKTLCYLLVRGNSALDRWCADYYRNDFVRVNTGASCALSSDLMILDDIIVQCFVPEAFASEVDKVYTLAKALEEVNIPRFYRDIYKAQMEFRVVIQKNKQLADALRATVVEKFHMKLGIFDVDGTLLSGFLVRDFAFFLSKRGLFDQRSLKAMGMAFHEFETGKSNYMAAASSILQAYARGIENQRINDIECAASDCSKGLSIRGCFLDSVQSLSGRRVILISASPVEVVRQLRKFFPADFVIASELEKKDGIYTGVISKDMTRVGMKKKELTGLLDYYKFSLSGSLGFGDTEHDLEFLELVDTPIATFPKEALKKVAKKRGWKIATTENDIKATLLTAK